MALALACGVDYSLGKTICKHFKGRGMCARLNTATRSWPIGRNG